MRKQEPQLARAQEIVRLREQWLTPTEISRRVGISRTSAANELKRQGRPDLIGRRGFAALTPERRREPASNGGRAVHAAGTGHQFTIEEARAAGSKGGRVIRDAPRRALPTPRRAP